MIENVKKHYDSLSKIYDDLWFYSSDFVSFMTDLSFLLVDDRFELVDLFLLGQELLASLLESGGKYFEDFLLEMLWIVLNFPLSDFKKIFLFNPERILH